MRCVPPCWRSNAGIRARRPPSTSRAPPTWPGDYDDALAWFGDAHARAPDAPAYALALARAASGLGRHDLEHAAVAAGLQAAPDDPALVLHDALTRVPADLAGAAARLQAVAGRDLACAEFAQALTSLVEGRPVPLPEAGPGGSADDRALARAAGARWVQRRAPDPRVFRGMPVAVLEHALGAASVDGLVLEFGVFHGRSLRLIAASSPGRVHGFDSFEGLPEAWNLDEAAGAYSTHGRRPALGAGVSLHAGWFEDTLPRFLALHAGPVRLLHVDCDLYSSTRTVLEGLRERLVAGTVIVFDDLLGYPGYEAHELRAFDELIEGAGMRYEVIAAALLGREVAVRILA